MADSPRDPHRIAGYLGSLGTFAMVSTLLARAVERRGTGWPRRYPVADLVMGAVATHKLSRIISKEGVATPLRAPFTVYEGEAGSAEVEERPRHGALHVAGELVTCPFCLAPWLSTAYVAGLLLAPGPTRTGAAVLATTAGSDVLQHLYSRVRAD